MAKIDINEIIECIDEYLEQNNMKSITPPEANELLAKKGILKDNESRSGKPLRDLLRANELPHAYKNGVYWVIPHS